MSWFKIQLPVISLPSFLQLNRKICGGPAIKMLALAAMGLAIALGTGKIKVLKSRCINYRQLVGGGVIVGLMALRMFYKSSRTNEEDELAKIRARLNAPPPDSQRTWGTDMNPLGTPDPAGNQKACQCRVKGTSKFSIITCYPNTPVETLREVLATETKAPAQRIRLSGYGKQLEDGRVLSDYIGNPHEHGGRIEIGMLIMPG